VLARAFLPARAEQIVRAVSPTGNADVESFAVIKTDGLMIFVTAVRKPNGALYSR